MENKYHYSAERNVQMVLYLLKANNIKKVIASPGATNVSIVASMQQDPFFEMYSCVDERSAGYMAVGMSEESGEPVVLSCTGATSARNYMPALTEAYYRKLPIIAITSTQDETHIGHLIAQVTDRSQQPKDLVIESVHIQNIRSNNDEWDCCIKINKALQSIRPIPGPVHINLATGMGGGYDVMELPATKLIRKYIDGDKLPELKTEGHIAIFIGSHHAFNNEETESIDKFCSTYNAVVFCDHTSSYKGKYRFMYSLVGAQDFMDYDISQIELLIHLGEISGDYDTLRKLIIKKVWRVSPDGEFRDTFKGKLENVFAITEKAFFDYYSKDGIAQEDDYLKECQSVYYSLLNNFGEIPFSNIYVASKLSKCIPDNSVLYLGILNTLRSWNYFEVSDSIHTVCNVGGFGIDGILSSLIGASISHPERFHFGIVGDLSFFYDMNSIGNRHIGKNLRIIVINNGHGQEFQMYNHGASFLGEDVNKFVAAEGHFGKMSVNLVKHYSEDLGYKYLSATNKMEFENALKIFVDITVNKSIIFEVFTNNIDENSALNLSRTIETDKAKIAKRLLKNIVKNKIIRRK